MEFEEITSFDALITKIGGFGSYQITCTLLLCVAAGFLNAWTGYDLVFVLYSPDKSCEKWNTNFTLIQQKLGDQEDPCDYEGSKIDDRFVHCENWTIDRKYFDATLRTQWGPCGNGALYKNMLGIFAIGSVVGLCFMSIVQDYVGRRIAFFISLTLTLIGSGSSLLASSMAVYVLLRFIQSTQSTCTYNIPFVWAQEFVGPEHRTWVNFLMTLFYSCATVSLGLVAYFCRTWIELGMVVTIPFALLYFYAFLLDESPRWLLSAGKLDDAERVIQKIARANKKYAEVPKLKDYLMSIASASFYDPEQSKGFKPFELFGTFNLRTKVLLLTVIWIANALVYNTVAFNAPNLGNMFVAYIAQASVEAPACIFNVLLSNRIGRMPPLIFAMALSSFFSFMCIPAYAGQWNEWFVIICAALSKFGICISFNILYQATGELYPTELRATGVGFNCIMSGLFVGAMPYILGTAATKKWLPMLILGLITMVATVCACFLPETKDQSMPQTASEADKISKVGYDAVKNHIKNLRFRKN